VVLRRDEARQLMLSSPIPAPIHATYDLRAPSAFALIRDAEGHAVRTVEAARALPRVDIEFADGTVGAHIEGAAKKSVKQDGQEGATRAAKSAKQGKLL